MEYRQHMAQRRGFDPSRAGYQARREVGAGGVLTVALVVATALAMAFWLALSQPGASRISVLPAADPAATAPVPGPADPVARR